MNIIISKKGSDRNESHRYQIWLRDFVNKGIASDYDIIKYPNLAILKFTAYYVLTYKIQITDLKYAEDICKSNPREYSCVTIDTNKLIKNQYSFSSLVSRKRSLSKINPARCFISSTLLFRSLTHPEINKINTINWPTIAVITAAGLTAIIVPAL